jgi:hypothetical protein
LVPSLPEDLKPECKQGIFSQTVPVDRALFIFNRMRGGTLASRVSFALNRGLEQVNLSDYDYVLRCDSDTVLAPDFIERNLKGLPDLVGNGGYAMLIRVKPFLELMGGRFHSVSDDSYLIYKFKMEGKFVRGIDDYSLETRLHKHARKDAMFVGHIYYKVGYEPIHIFGFLITKYTHRNSRRYEGDVIGYNPWWIVAGYMLTFLKRDLKFEFADRIWNYQVRRLLPMFNKRIEGIVAK